MVRPGVVRGQLVRDDVLDRPAANQQRDRPLKHARHAAALRIASADRADL